MPTMLDVGSRRGRATLAVLGVSAVALTACGGNGGSSAASGTSSAPVDTSVLGDKKPATGAPVKIGLFNVEGGSAVSLPDIGDAAQAAANYANDYLGGLGGHKIEVVRCGDKADGASAAACGNTFIQAGVAAVVSGQPATADQIVPQIKGAGIPWVGASPSAATELGDDNAYFFSSGFVGLLAGQASYAKQQGWKSVTLIGSENPQLVASVNAIGKPLFQAHGVTLNVVTVPQGTADATSQVTAATQGKPDALSIVADNTVCQAVLTAVGNIGATQPKMVSNACVADSVLKAVGDTGMDKSVLFTQAVITGSDTESKLYQAVMKQYAPKANASGLTPVGYQAMLGFVRAINGGGVSGAVTPVSITTALKASKDLPLPAGNGSTFSCGTTAFPSPQIKATICNAQLFVTTYKGTTSGTDYQTIDTSKAVSGG